MHSTPWRAMQQCAAAATAGELWLPAPTCAADNATAAVLMRCCTVQQKDQQTYYKAYHSWIQQKLLNLTCATGGKACVDYH
jgi:hypothetical protein